MTPTSVEIVFTPATKIQAEHVDWAWADRVPLAMLTLLVGNPGHGKSTLLLELCARLSRGQLAGDLYGLPVTVAVATAEDALASVVRPRLDAAAADLDRVQLISVRRDEETGILALPADLPMLEARCKADDVKFLVIDPLVAHIPVMVDGYRDQHVRRVLAPLAGLAERCHLAAVSLMHLSKGEADSVLAMINGSVGFGGAARSVLLLGLDPEDPDGPSRLVAHAKCNVGPLMPTLRLQIEGRETQAADGTPIRTSGLVWCGEAPTIHAADLVQSVPLERPALEQAKTAIRTLLAQGPMAAEKAINALHEQHIATRTWKRAKTELSIQSVKESFSGRWTWSLPDPVQSAETTAQQAAEQVAAATTKLRAEIDARAAAKDPPYTKGRATTFLTTVGLTWQQAREVVDQGNGTLWQLEKQPTKRGKPVVLSPYTWHPGTLGTDHIAPPAVTNCTTNVFEQEGYSLPRVQTPVAPLASETPVAPLPQESAPPDPVVDDADVLVVDLDDGEDEDDPGD